MGVKPLRRRQKEDPMGERGDRKFGDGMKYF